MDQSKKKKRTHRARKHPYTRNQEDVQVQSNQITADATEPLSFSTMQGKLAPSLLNALHAIGYDKMTPVQNLVLSSLPTFRHDCLVKAKTGTGKTLAFLLPILHTLLSSPRLPLGQVSVLIISPTRELALQIAKECNNVTTHTPWPIDCHTAFGGTARASNHQTFLNGNPSILVATPGRLIDYLSDALTAAKFSNLRTLVLDEADTMLERGFLEDVRRILGLLPPKSNGWQGMCFSATVPKKIMDVIDCVLSPGYSNLSTVDENETPTIEKILQYYMLIQSPVEIFVSLTSLLDHESRTSSKILVFGITANMVALYSKLFSQGLTHLKVYELHSRLSQNVRTRTTEAFKIANEGILFASDVVGRGMDFPNVDLVVQVGLPSSGEQYVHRVGRTGRAENSGRAILLLTQGERFFFSRNPQLPIQPHPEAPDIITDASSCAPKVEAAMHAVDETTKQRAYSSYLGFFAGSGLLKPLGLDKAGLVSMANAVATQGMYCPEPPPMEKRVVGKMGLKGVPGLKYAQR